VINFTVTNPVGTGYATVFPCGAPRPEASNLNYVAGQSVPNLVIAKLGTSGRVCVFSNVATDLLADVSGYFPAGSGYAPIANPTRILDTRSPVARLAAGAVLELPVGGVGGVPLDAVAAVVNFTVTNPAAVGYVTVYPCGAARPEASNLNYVAGQSVPNLVFAKLGAGGRVCAYSNVATDLIADVAGYFPAGSGYVPIDNPTRILDTRGSAPCGLVSAVFCETFDNLNNWSFAHWRSEMPGSADANSTASIVNGQAQIVAADKNYGDATLRSNTKYALGEIRLTISDNSGGWPLLGSAFVGLTTDPYNAPSIKRDNGEGPTPANGVLIQMRDNCREPWAGPQGSVYVNHVETVTTAVCLGAMPSGPTELRVTNGHVEFWSAGAKYAEMNVAVPATGYLLLGVHNHASEKYSDGPGPMPAVIGLFDNVSYPAAGRTSSYRNGAGVTAVGTSARVVFNAYAANTPVGAAVVVNGHSHPFTPYYPLSRSVAESVAIPVSDLVVGNNTINIVGGFTPVANVDLVIEGASA
jgi:hypothetical protein